MKTQFRLIVILLSLFFLTNENIFANDPCQATWLPPPPDTCSYIIGDTQGASAGTMTSFPCSGINAPDVWYRVIVPACNPELVVNVLGGSLAGQLQSGVLYLYSGSCDSLVFISCQHLNVTTYFASDTVTSLSAGDTLLFRIREISGGGAFNLCVFGACPTGISAPKYEQKNHLQLYPNPARSELSVSSNLLSGKGKIEIDNALGQNMLRLESNTHGKPFTIDLSPLSPGVYFLRLTSEGLTESRKFSIEK